MNKALTLVVVHMSSVAWQFMSRRQGRIRLSQRWKQHRLCLEDCLPTHPYLPLASRTVTSIWYEPSNRGSDASCGNTWKRAFKAYPFHINYSDYSLLVRSLQGQPALRMLSVVSGDGILLPLHTLRQVLLNITAQLLQTFLQHARMTGIPDPHKPLKFLSTSKAHTRRQNQHLRLLQ